MATRDWHFSVDSKNEKFHPQCSATAPVLSKKKISERNSEPRDPTAAVKDWVKSVDVLKAEPDNPFGDDLEFYHVQGEAAFRDSGYYDGIVDKSPFDTKPSLTELMNKGLSEKDATRVIDEIVTKANKNKLEKGADDELVYVPGLDKCFTEKSKYDRNSREGSKEKTTNELIKKVDIINSAQCQTDIVTSKVVSENKNNNMKTDITGHGLKPDNKHTIDARPKSLERDVQKLHDIDARPKSLERDVQKLPDKTVSASPNSQGDSSPESEYQSGKESLDADSDNTNDALTPGSEVESSVDTGEVITNEDTAADNANDKTDIDRAAENCVIS